MNHWWSHIPGFYAIFAFIGCIGMVFFAKFLAKHFLYRDEDYYGDDHE